MSEAGEVEAEEGATANKYIIYIKYKRNRQVRF